MLSLLKIQPLSQPPRKPSETSKTEKSCACTIFRIFFSLSLSLSQDHGNVLDYHHCIKPVPALSGRLIPDNLTSFLEPRRLPLPRWLMILYHFVSSVCQDPSKYLSTLVVVVFVLGNLQFALYHH
jgi:hypothetical protein